MRLLRGGAHRWLDASAPLPLLASLVREGVGCAARAAPSHTVACPRGDVSDALAARAVMGIAISRRERTETRSSAADEYGKGHRKEPRV